MGSGARIRRWPNLHGDRLPSCGQWHGDERARDRPVPGACANVQTGGAGPDRLTGLALGDALRGLGGNDVLIGRDGDDCLTGGTGISGSSAM
jgi:hypothetical protein